MKHLLATTLAASMAFTAAPALADDFTLSFDDGVTGWRTVLDGVMGGRSSGRITAPERGVLRFAGDLSLENNGGFSQMRTNVPEGSFAGAEGIEIRVRGDGRTYNFDVRVSNVRMMAGGFQQSFETEAGEWTTIRLPFSDFRLYSFGNRVPSAPTLQPALVESVGVTLSDKKPGPFELEVDSIRAFDGSSQLVSNESSSGDDLVSVAKGAGLNTLLDLVTAAELSLPSNERVTIFAPTDEAFAALPEETVKGLLSPEGRDTLRSILTYHVTVPGWSSSDLLSRRSVDTLNGQRLSVGTDGGFSIDGAGFVATDVPFDGGVVHVIDTVLMPELRSIGEIAGATDKLSTLAAAVEAAGLERQLVEETGPWTVFAPVNSAFASLPSGTVESLLRPENRSKLVNVLGLYVVPSRIYASDLLASREARSFFGEPIAFGLEGGSLTVNGAKVVASDIEASNGVVHLIDGVILPSESTAEPFRVSADAASEAIRLFELAINRGAPLFNAGQTAGCAAVYELTIEAMVSLGAGELGPEIVLRLQEGLNEGRNSDTARAASWAYRRTLDDVYAMLSR